MKITMSKIKRHWWCPFMVKEVIFEIENDPNFITEKIIQPMSNGWSIVVDANDYEMNVDEDVYDRPFEREKRKILKLLNI